MQAQDEHPASIDGAAPEFIRTKREFMDVLRALRVRSGLSYRDVDRGQLAGPARRPRVILRKRGGRRPLLVWGTVLSLITWLPFADGPVPFWAVWLGWCGPALLLPAIAALFGQPRGSSSAEYLRYEQRTTPRLPGLY
jgi:hypothetical protein